MVLEHTCKRSREKKRATGQHERRRGSGERVQKVYHFSIQLEPQPQRCLFKSMPVYSDQNNFSVACYLCHIPPINLCYAIILHSSFSIFTLTGTSANYYFYLTSGSCVCVCVCLQWMFINCITNTQFVSVCICLYLCKQRAH